MLLLSEFSCSTIGAETLSDDVVETSRRSAASSSWCRCLSVNYIVDDVMVTVAEVLVQSFLTSSKSPNPMPFNDSPK